MALKTIQNFIAMTDTRLCPTYLSADDRYWFANHRDPAFAELQKSVYRHELPCVYGPRVAAEWRHVLFGTARLSNLGEGTRPGESI